MSNFTVWKTADPASAGKISAEIIAKTVIAKPDCLLGLATGSTPVPIYKELVAQHKKSNLDFSKVRTVNLDEYVGLSAEHPQSYHHFMMSNFFDHINIDLQNTRIPDGMAADLSAFCDQYEQQITNWGGIDLQLLGIGLNGHIGFNEPASVFTRRTHLTDLTESTRKANQRFFNSLDEVPRQAITMGIGTIMTARKILLVCTGIKKAEILERTFFGPIDPMVPASVLQFHQNVTVVADEAALKTILQKHPEFSA
ncbi:glucosamine-6-phosphate deaminase [Flexilinea flocculi]|jgi:glucosamine-6-phosphate deaminase|uniref:Glucosamine-6-phosphate deaminase n=1 Tax=Flexilinea flocculi TaxID=1678840 RepID=A0A0K8PA74_9CHLR|nr:glucosamine-6-phosphate deaminase [Flexilinea flocculi]GAP39558.1 glucosamine-6-phosphate isomerase [Flexilinea flocculi]